MRTVATGGDTFLALWFLIFGSGGSVKQRGKREISLFTGKGKKYSFSFIGQVYRFIIKRIVLGPYHLKKKCSVCLSGPFDEKILSV